MSVKKHRENPSILLERNIFSFCVPKYPEIVSFLLSKGAKLESVDQEGKTPLMWAATKGNLEIVKLLLAKGADITKTSKEGKTALNYAMANGHIKITTILTEKQEELEANKKP